VSPPTDNIPSPRKRADFPQVFHHERTLANRLRETSRAAILRDFQADLDAGLNINHACRKAGIGPTTYYRWKALQEDPVSNEQLRMAELESEVGRLKLLVAELALDRRMLQEALKKKP